jgi:ABC-2 type transport system ATP-binding protein
MSEQILDLRCDRAQEVAQWIEPLPGVRDVSLFGAGLHVVSLDAAVAKTAIREKLDSKGITQYTLEKILPGMEDVFISLIEEDDRTIQNACNKEIGS